MALDMYLIEDKEAKKLKVDLHSGRRKQLASLRTVVSHVLNLITGVTKGFQYKMRLVYAHFPINVNVDSSTVLEVRNFLGDKRVRVINMLPGVTITRSEGVKDELTVTGNSVENVSRSCALVSQQCNVRWVMEWCIGVSVAQQQRCEQHTLTHTHSVCVLRMRVCSRLHPYMPTCLQIHAN